MPNRRYSVERIRSIVQEMDQGVPMKALRDRHGVSLATLYRWRGRYAGLATMSSDDLSRLEALERELAAVRRQLEEARSDLSLLRRVVRQKGVTVARGRVLIATCVERLGVSERQACRALGVQRSSMRYGNRPPPCKSAANSERDATPRRW
ncbi:MAG: transposase [Myxococcota bacterium]